MSSVSPSTRSSVVSPADVAERVRSLQLGTSERKTAEFGLRGLRWLLLLALIGGGVWWLSQHDANFAEKLQQWIPTSKPKWDVVPVRTEGGDVVLLDLTGYVSPKQKVNVSARIPGLLTALNFEEGQHVQAGDVLAQLDDSTLRADYEHAAAAEAAAESRLLEMQNGALPGELEQSRTAVEQARDKLKLVERELARLEKIRRDIPAAEFDQVESSVFDARANLKTLEQKLKLMEDGPRAERIRAAEADVNQAKAMVTKAKTALENTVLTAPIAGVVLERHGEVGEHIRPDALTTGIYVLADLTKLEVQVDVEEQSLGKLRIGQPCRVIPDAYSDRTYEATISRWQPQVNRARAVVRVILTITEPDDHLLAEMNCRAVILDTTKPTEPESLWIPSSAALTEGGKSGVYVVEDGAARLRPVELGATRDDQVQVVSGLSKTDLIILPGKQPLADGQKVQ